MEPSFTKRSQITFYLNGSTTDVISKVTNSYFFYCGLRWNWSLSINTKASGLLHCHHSSLFSASFFTQWRRKNLPFVRSWLPCLVNFKIIFFQGITLEGAGSNTPTKTFWSWLNVPSEYCASSLLACPKRDALWPKSSFWFLYQPRTWTLASQRDGLPAWELWNQLLPAEPHALF